MSLTIFRRRRRTKLLAESMPESDAAVLRRGFAAYSLLPAEQRQRLHDLTRVLIAEKQWEGCAGLTLTGEMQLLIAAQACLLLLGFDLDPRTDPFFPGLRTILVYPAHFYADTARQGPAGVVSEGFHNAGEAWYRGPVIVSWRDARRDAAHGADGRNLVLHEFAHKLDMLDGVIDGTPPLGSAAEYRTWREVMTGAFTDLSQAAARGEPTLLNAYGATSPAEFFAVVTEVFFERPREMRAENPSLYETLRQYYRQDPAAWAWPDGGSAFPG